MKLRVLHVINSLEVGGAERLVSILLPRLRDRNFDVELLVVGNAEGAFRDELVRQGIVVHCLKCRTPYTPAAFVREWKFLRSHSYDIIHTHLFPSMFYGLLSVPNRRQGPVLITTEHSSRSGRRVPGLRWLDEWIYSRFAAVVCVSDAVRRALREWVPGSDGKTRVIGNGVVVGSRPKESAHQKSLAGSSPRLKILTVGRCVEAKACDVLIRAVAEVDGVEAKIAGDGPLLRTWQELALRLGVGDRVQMLGMRNDVGDLMRSSDVFVQTSRWEGQPMAALEAMASGLPSIVSDAPGLSGLAGDGVLLFPTGDCQALAQQLRRLRDDGALREEMGKQALQRASQYDVGISADRYAAVYRELATAV